jgi:ribosomal protein S18 acetylase RimI-like enzyme
LSRQLRRLALPIGESLSQAIDEFSCEDTGDPVAQNVHEFLAKRRFEPGIRHGISSTYLLTDSDCEPPLLGYVTLTVDAVRLTKSEKQRMDDLTGIPEFGALRIQMIGVDHRHQGTHCGVDLLEATTGIAQGLSALLAVRYVLADANIKKVEWYEKAGFVRNRAKKYKERPDPERSVSMRLDLLEELAPVAPAEATLSS